MENFCDTADRYIRFVLSTREKPQHTEIKYMEYFKSVFKDTPIASITQSDVYEAKHHLLEHIQARMQLEGKKGNGQVTTNRHMARLKHFFTIANDWGVTSNTPARNLKLFKEPKNKLNYLTMAQVIKLLHECQKSKNKEMYLAVLMILSSGARKSEVLNITFDQIDWDTGSARIINTKNGESHVLYFNDECMSILRSMRRETGDVIKRKTIDKGFKMACARAGLMNTSLHTLRHTAATSLALKGYSLLEIAAYLNQKDVRSTLRYQHLVPSDIGPKSRAVTNEWRAAA